MVFIGQNNDKSLFSLDSKELDTLQVKINKSLELKRVEYKKLQRKICFN
jgi:hypothetical protein